MEAFSQNRKKDRVIVWKEKKSGGLERVKVSERKKKAV